MAKGRYIEFLIDPYGKAIKPNVHLYGGFGGDESNRNDPRRYIMQTIIERPHRDEAQEYGENYYYIADLYGGAVIDGFHFLADYNYNLTRWDYPRSGGIYLKANGGKGVQIKNCIFRENNTWLETEDYSTDNGGGGIFI